MKRILLFIMLVTSTICSAYPVQSIGFLNDQGAEKVVNATNPLPITNSSGNSAIASTTLAITNLALQIASNTLSAIAAIASTAANTNVTVSTITAPLATGTNAVGLIGPDAATTGSATANPTSPLGTLLYLTDNANLQRWFTAIVQADGVNGNNIAGVAEWYWNGATYDRMVGSKTLGLLADTPLTTAKVETLRAQQATEAATLAAAIASTTKNIGASTFNGWNASITISVGTLTPVICPELPVGTRMFRVTSTQRINEGGSDITSASAGLDFVPANAPGCEYYTGTTTPAIYWCSQTLVATVTIKPAKPAVEPLP